MRELSPETSRQLAEQLARVPRTATSARDLVLEAAFLLAAVDGQVTPLELGQFGEIAADAAEATGGAPSAVDTPALAKELAARLQSDGWKRRAEAIGAALVGTPHAEAALRAAATVAFVDDAIAPAEAEALDTLASALGLAEERAEAILAAVRVELFGD